MKQLLGIITVFALGTVGLQAAKVPMSQKELEKESSHIVSGKVISVTTKVQKSKFERSLEPYSCSTHCHQLVRALSRAVRWYCE